MSEHLEPEAYWIHGVGIGGYRSFATAQKIAPFRKINLIIGQNNSGKSNIIRFLSQHYGKILAKLRQQQPYSDLKELDQNRDFPAVNLQLWIALPVEGRPFVDLLQAMLSQLRGPSGEEGRLLHKLHTDLAKDSGVSWIAFDNSPGGKFEISGAFAAEVRERNFLTENQWQRIWSRLTSSSGGDLTHWVRGTLSTFSRLSSVVTAPPEVIIIPAIRQVVPSVDEKEWDWAGRGLILRLLQLRDPGHTPAEQELKKKFEAVTKFLRSVTESKTATLEIPHTRETIYVQMNGRTLPLEALGTGIHEVVILAAAATVHSKKVICIEEPEIHLHPILQRKLLQYLEEQTDNQYFFATHSAHLLQHPNAAIFHVRLENGQSVVRSVSSPGEKSEVCVDLGYRASDLLQANCVIWVEGPSDRLYLRHWIQTVADDLIEGIDYSIMFYGGRLLSHLSAKDPEVEDFISLRRLNRFIAVVMDSDCGRPRQRLNKTKRRVRNEFNEDKERGFAWVTQGREIENYLPVAVLDRAIRKVHPSTWQVARPGRYERLLSYRAKGSGEWKLADKVKVAREVVLEPPDLDQLDLRYQVSRMVRFIRGANES